MARLPVAIVHDYLTQRGGAERVVLSMLKAFPDAPVYTALYEPEATYPEFGGYMVRPLWTNRLGTLRRDHRRGLCVYPLAFSMKRVDADVVLCSSSGFAHGVKASGRKVVYCHTPARWLYGQAPGYVAGWPSVVRGGLRAASPALRAWDRRAATGADQYFANSAVVRGRVHDTYGIDAPVVAPPVTVDAARSTAPVPGVEPGYVLCVSRLLRYKNIDAVIDAFALLPGARLVIVGEGPEEARIQALAGASVTLLGRVTEEELGWLYANSAGLVAASHEDFGLTPIEAGAYGKPSAVLRYGGFLDTVVDGQSGVFFDEPVAEAIAVAVATLLDGGWDATAITEHFASWSQEAFSRRLQTCVNALSASADHETALVPA